MLAFVALLESVSVSFSGSLALFAELMTCCRLCSNKQCGGADSWACFPRASAPWWPIRRLLNPRMSSGSFCCSFTEAFPPRGVFFFPSLLLSVSLRLRSAAGSCCLRPVHSRLSAAFITVSRSAAQLLFARSPIWSFLDGNRKHPNFSGESYRAASNTTFFSNFDKFEVISSCILSVWRISVINTSIHPLFSISFLIFFFFFF